METQASNEILSNTFTLPLLLRINNTILITLNLNIYIIKTDIYLIGFIHSEAIIYLIGATKLGRKRPEAAK